MITVIVAWGVRKTSTLNNIFTTLNLLTISTVVVSGVYFGMYTFHRRLFINIFCVYNSEIISIIFIHFIIYL